MCRIVGMRQIPYNNIFACVLLVFCCFVDFDEFQRELGNVTNSGNYTLTLHPATNLQRPSPQKHNDIHDYPSAVACNCDIIGEHKCNEAVDNTKQNRLSKHEKKRR